MAAAWYEWRGDDLWLHLRLQPKARRTAFVGPLDDVLKLEVKAPPLEGKANAELVAFLAKSFGVTKKAVVIESGARARTKRVKIQSPNKLPEELQIVKTP
jgi:uncharacterized protein (TIGR00251 family)